MIDIRQLKYGGSDAAMKVLLEEADRIIEAHRDALFYNLINLNPLMHGKSNYKTELCAKMIEGYKKLFV